MASIILRPISDATHGAWPWSPTSEPLHYDEVDEVTPDGDTTTIVTSEDLVVRIDHFNHETLDLPDGAVISAVRVYMRCRKYVIFVLYPADSYIREGVQINSTGYDNPNPEYPGVSYSNFYYEWVVNPATGLAWTESGVNGAKIRCLGISGLAYDPFMSEYYTLVFCTQAWMEVFYSIPSLKPSSSIVHLAEAIGIV